MRVEAEHRFPVSVHAAFAYITDQANWPDYWPGLVRIEPGSRWGEPGDVTRIVLRALRREVPMEITLRRFDRDRLVEYASTQDGLPDMRHERHFLAAGESLQYRVVVEFEPRGLYDRVVVRAAVARTIKRTIANLDTALVR
ncbi:MAG TPA: SRPBCC family protein [Solirubrobacteraceae bacterium]|nr:SRPBCC family protein [Solirubrobacteraceae bacterium]